MENSNSFIKKIKDNITNLMDKAKTFDYKSIKSEDIVDFVRKPKVFVPIILLVGGYNLVAYGINNYLVPYKKSQAAFEVNAIKITPQDVPLSTEIVGQTRSPQAVEIYTRVNGFLDKQVYKEGTWVKAGDVLFEIDKRPFIAQLEASQAEVVSSEAALKTAKLTLDRVKPLAKASALSQQSLDDATGEYLRAKANLDRSKANLETAKLNLEYCTIRSPIDGLASVREVALGTYIQVGGVNSRLTQINQMNPMWVYFSMSEDQMLKFNKMIKDKKIKETTLEELEVEIQMIDGTVYPYLGKIGFADVLYNVNTGTRLMRAVFPNPDTQLQQGQFVTAKIKGLIQPNAILIPQVAVQQSAKGAYVWVIDKDNRVHNRTVDTGPWNGNNWVIESGLVAGDQVVVSNVLRMSPDQLVTATYKEQPKPELAAPKLPEPTVSTENNPVKPGNEIEGVNINKAETPLIGDMPTVKTPNISGYYDEKEVKEGTPKEIAPVPSQLKEEVK